MLHVFVTHDPTCAFRISGVPPGLLQACRSLWLLGLSGNPITVVQLRQVPGFEALDGRRRARADKQVGGEGGRCLGDGTRKDISLETCCD
jgi:hypothetical protein